MAIVIESTATQVFTAPSGGDTLTILKPTGLTVGDLMIADVAHHSNAASATWN